MLKKILEKFLELSWRNRTDNKKIGYISNKQTRRYTRFIIKKYGQDLKELAKR